MVFFIAFPLSPPVYTPLYTPLYACELWISDWKFVLSIFPVCVKFSCSGGLAQEFHHPSSFRALYLQYISTNKITNIYLDKKLYLYVFLSFFFVFGRFFYTKIFTMEKAKMTMKCWNVCVIQSLYKAAYPHASSLSHQYTLYPHGIHRRIQW